MNQYFEADKLALVHSGTHYFDTLEQLIHESVESLHLQTYIFNNDETGLKIVNALKNAALRGVHVYVLADAFGSFPFPKHLQKEMSSAGVHFRLFSPLFSTESILPWRRLHHKIVVSDTHKALIGGINIANKYNSINNSVAWLDYAVLVQGNICGTLTKLCEQFYRKKKIIALTIDPIHKNSTQTSSENLIRFRRNDWIRKKNEIHKTYVTSLNEAKSSITIVASYFLPGANFRKLLRQASERGVKVKIIMAGKSDSYSVKLAENYLYDFYFRHNIELYEWNDSILHGKVMLVDNSLATIGSYNLNFLSHYISIELNADIRSPAFIKQLSNHFSQITHNYSTTFKLSVSGQKKGPLRKIQLWLAYNFFRLMMTIFVSARRKINRK